MEDASPVRIPHARSRRPVIALAVTLAVAPVGTAVLSHHPTAVARAARRVAPSASVELPPSRSVTTRDVEGGLQRITVLPAASLFSRHGGGPRASCSLTADRDGFMLSDGRTVDAGTTVTSGYHFVEGIATPFVLPPGDLPDDVLGLPTRGSLTQATRTFSVFCDRSYYAINFRGLITVPLTDPLLDPRRRLDVLRNQLRLVRPVIAPPPVVPRYGGLVTRSPVWLAVHPRAWVTQRSPSLRYRGATLTLVASPRRLDVSVAFVPDPARPSAAFRGWVRCIPSVRAVAGATAMPQPPELPEQSLPGVGGPCRWTPPGPGTATLTARVTYTVVFWVDGWTEQLADYVWTSLPVTFGVGELRAVTVTPW